MYVDQAGMVSRYGESHIIQLTDREGTGEVNSSVLAGALTDAANIIHGYARAGGYQVPFAPVPDGVARWQADIARFLLHTTELPEQSQVLANYKAAMDQLRSLAKGEFTLQAAGETAPAPADQVVTLDAPDRVFTSDSLKGF